MGAVFGERNAGIKKKGCVGMPKKKPAAKPREEDRLFKVSLTSKDTDIKEFKASYQGNWSGFVRDALREKIQREHLMSRTQHRPLPAEGTQKPLPPKVNGSAVTRVTRKPAPSKTTLTAEEIRRGLLNQENGS